MKLEQLHPCSADRFESVVELNELVERLGYGEVTACRPAPVGRFALQLLVGFDGRGRLDQESSPGSPPSSPKRHPPCGPPARR